MTPDNSFSIAPLGALNYLIDGPSAKALPSAAH